MVKKMKTGSKSEITPPPTTESNTERLSAEQAIKQTEVMLQDIIEKNPLSIQIVDKEGFTIQVNSAHTKLFGSVIPSDYSIFTDVQLIQKGLGELIERMKNGEVVHFPDSYFNIHDSIPGLPDVPVWVRTIGFPLNDNNSKPERFVFMHENITGHKQREEEHAYQILLHKFRSEMTCSINRQLSFREILQQSAEVIMRNFDIACVQIWTMNREINSLELQAHAELSTLCPESAERIHIGNLLASRVVAEGQMITSNSIADRPLLIDASWARHHNIIAYAGLPLFVENNLVGVLTIFAGTLLLERTLSPLAGSAVTLAQGIMRKEAEEALQASEERYRSLVESSDDPIYLVGRNLKYLFANEKLLSRLGKSLDEVVGQDYIQIHSPEGTQEFSAKVEQVCKSGKPVSYEHKSRRDGREFIRTLSPVKDPKTKTITTVTVISKDITERKRAAEELFRKEEHHKAVIENIFKFVPEGVLVLTESLNLLKQNKAFNDIVQKYAPLLGYTEEELAQKIIEPLRHKIESEDSKEIYIWKKDRSRTGLPEGNQRDELVLEFNAARIFLAEEEEEEEARIVVSLLDITERKRAEEVLKVSEEKYKTLLNTSPDSILLIDMEGIITEVSEIGLELFGADTIDDLVGNDILLFVPSEEKNTIREILEKTMNEGIAQNIELKIRKKNQSLFAGEISATLIQGSDGVPLLYMIIIRDISQRKKMEIKQMHADRMINLGEMASGIAHEINQPLNIISMVMDKILFESAKTETIDIGFLKNKSNKIFENITRIRNIIDHIRAFSRSHDDYILTAFDINSSIENAVSMIMEQFKYLGINLNLQLEKQIPQILGNTYQFEQVIVNLLVNAKDAVIEKKSKQEEYVEMIVGIRSYQENQFLIVEITDNGIGVSNDDINNILLPFYTTKDEGKGTGLGLSICYQIIKEMDGTIDITSDIFYGTKIKIVLDIQKKN